MSATTDRLKAVAAQFRAAANTAVADADAAEKAYADEVELEDSRLSAAVEAALQTQRSADATAAAMAKALGDAMPQPDAAPEPAPVSNDAGPVQQSPEQLAVAEAQPAETTEEAPAK